MKRSKFDSRYWGCPVCGWPIRPEDDDGSGGVVCACRRWVQVPNPPRPSRGKGEKRQAPGARETKWFALGLALLGALFIVAIVLRLISATM